MGFKFNPITGNLDLVEGSTTIISGGGGGAGDVVGPASATNNNIAVFDGVTGKLIKDGGKTIATLDSAIATALSAANAAQSDIDTHEADVLNPHGVTKSQVGLGSVDNTSDLDKPVSTAQQTAFDGKSNVGHTHVEADITDLVHYTSSDFDTDFGSKNTDNLSQGTTNLYMTVGEQSKLGYISITQSVDLDDIETRVDALDASVVLKGTWDASSGSFPGGGTAQAGYSWIVSVSGTVDGVDFVANDRILAVLDNASTTTYSGNWHKLDYTDQVLSVAGKTGAVTLLTSDISGISAFGATLVDDADAATARTTLGLGSIATLNSIDISSNTNLAATSPIVLTDDTLSLTQSGIDHGSIGGLTDDDHSQYALLAGRSGGQTLYGDTAASGSLTLNSTSNATKGKIYFGSSSAYDGANYYLGVGTASPSDSLHVVKSGSAMTVLLENYTNSGRSVLDFKRALGTSGSPSAIPGSGYILGDFVAHGHDGSNFQEAAAIRFISGSSYSSSSSEGNVVIYATPSGSTTASEVARFKGSGDASINTATPDGKFEIKTDSTYGKQVLKLNQVDSDQPFIDFAGTSGSGTSTSITTRTVAAVSGYVWVEINGSKKWIAYYNDPTA